MRKDLVKWVAALQKHPASWLTGQGLSEGLWFGAYQPKLYLQSLKFDCVILTVSVKCRQG